MAGWNLPVFVLWMVWLVVMSTLMLFAATIYSSIARAAFRERPNNEHYLSTLQHDESEEGLLQGEGDDNARK